MSKSNIGGGTSRRQLRELRHEELDAASGGGGGLLAVDVQGAPIHWSGETGGAGGVADMFGGPLHVHFKN